MRRFRRIRRGLSGLRHTAWTIVWNLQQKYAMRTMILTLAVALFNVAIAAPMINQMLQQISQTGRLEGPEYAFEFSIIYILASLGLCVYASMLVQPKRLVSPLSAQIITGLVLALAIAGYAANPNTVLMSNTMNQTELQEIRPQNTQGMSSLMLLGFFVITMIPLLGVAQGYALRWLVGLNADDNLPISGFSVPVSNARTMDGLRYRYRP